MTLKRYVARSLADSVKVNTLDIRTEWNLIEMKTWEPEMDPSAWIDDGSEDDEEDWELVSILSWDDEKEPDATVNQ